MMEIRIKAETELSKEPIETIKSPAAAAANINQNAGFKFTVPFLFFSKSLFVSAGG